MRKENSRLRKEVRQLQKTIRDLKKELAILIRVRDGEREDAADGLQDANDMIRHLNEELETQRERERKIIEKLQNRV